MCSTFTLLFGDTGEMVPELFHFVEFLSWPSPLRHIYKKRSDLAAEHDDHQWAPEHRQEPEDAPPGNQEVGSPTRLRGHHSFNHRKQITQSPSVPLPPSRSRLC